LKKNPSLEQSWHALLAQILDKFLFLAQISPWFWRVFSGWLPSSAQGSAEVVSRDTGTSYVKHQRISRMMNVTCLKVFTLQLGCTDVMKV